MSTADPSAVKTLQEAANQKKTSRFKDIVTLKRGELKHLGLKSSTKPQHDTMRYFLTMNYAKLL